MFIYKVIFYNHFDNKFYENHHKFFKDSDDAKEYVKTLLEDNAKVFHDYNFRSHEYDCELGNLLYKVIMEHDGYYNNIIKKKIEIYKEQIY